MSKRHYTTADVAERFNVTPNAVQIWRHKGIGPKYIKISRRVVRYTEEALQEYENEVMVETKTS